MSHVDKSHLIAFVGVILPVWTALVVGLLRVFFDKRYVRQSKDEKQ